MNLSKRDILFALAALGASAAALPARAQSAAPPDLAAGRMVGAAYLAANPHVSVAALRQQIAPTGLDTAAIARLRAQAVDDFRTGRVFIYKGWRLSETEGRVFALLV